MHRHTHTDIHTQTYIYVHMNAHIQHSKERPISKYKVQGTRKMDKNNSKSWKVGLKESDANNWSKWRVGVNMICGMVRQIWPYLLPKTKLDLKNWTILHIHIYLLGKLIFFPLK